jgi:L-lysine 2,3-aminomutase
MDNHKFAMKHPDIMVKYLKQHPEITDILITGGDPLFMNAASLKRYTDAILETKQSNLQNIRIGTKALSIWPYRFLTDKDAEDLLEIFRRITDAGIHLSIMAHINHYAELSTYAFREAVVKIHETGATIKSQSPILNHINASPGIWSKMWGQQANLGIIPYYMFVARNTGAQDYFAVPLYKAYEVYREAYSRVSGLARTVRGPSMSAFPGKVKVDGVTTISGEKVFVLSFIQGRNPDWVKKPFFADYNENAIWLDDLKPAFGEKKFFFEK